MTVELYHRPEWSLSIVYRPHYDLAVALLDEAIESTDAAKVRRFQREQEREGGVALPPLPLTQRSTWLETLLRSYREDDQRLTLHGLLLTSPSLEALISVLERQASPDRPVIAALSEALLVESRALMSAWGVSDIEPARFERAWRDQWEGALSLDDLMATAEYSPLLRDLQRCRRALFNGPPPPLTLIHCPALKSSGRGGAIRQNRIVAVSLDQPPSWIFCQALHEEVHAITDLRARRSSSVRDTRAGREGSALHQALESAAMEAGTALIERHCAQRTKEDVAWRRAYGYGLPLHSERASALVDDLKQGLTPSRKRLIALFVSALISAWSLAMLSRGSGVIIALIWASLFAALCYLPSHSAWLARRRVVLGIYELSAQQRIAVTVTSALQALMISLSL